MKNYNLILASIFLFILTCNSVYSQKGENTSSDDKTTSIVEEEFEKLEESNITTKIYEGASSSNDLTDKESNLDFTIQDDVITKDELLNKKNNKNKVYNRKKNLGVKDVKASSNKLVMLPWLVLIVLVLVLGVIFRVLIKRKI